MKCATYILYKILLKEQLNVYIITRTRNNPQKHEPTTFFVRTNPQNYEYQLARNGILVYEHSKSKQVAPKNYFFFREYFLKFINLLKWQCFNNNVESTKTRLFTAFKRIGICYRKRVYGCSHIWLK